MGDRHPARGRAADVELLQRRCIHRARHRHAIFDQGNIHREFAAALNELPGAIERIDQNKSIGFDHGRRRAGFFGDDRQIRHVALQALADDFVGRKVRCGYR